MHSHFIFPGFVDRASPDALVQFNELEFHTRGYDARITLGENFTFKGNPDLRLLYVYRNPLDQIVSIFDHSMDHVDRTLLIPPRKYNSERPYESASDLALRGGAESYLKQYLTYRYFADIGFPQLMMVSYEQLKRDTATTFDSMLNFCGARLEAERRANLVRRAVELSSSSQVAKLEKKKGGAIGGDQTGDRQSHMRGGDIGKWQDRLSPEAVSHVWSLFARYGVHESNFQLH